MKLNLSEVMDLLRAVDDRIGILKGETGGRQTEESRRLKALSSKLHDARRNL